MEYNSYKAIGHLQNQCGCFPNLKSKAIETLNLFEYFGTEMIIKYKKKLVGWRNNKVLLYSTENYIQYPEINHNGKEYIYVYMYN